MDPLHFLTQSELIQFFHCKKTEISCMEEPNTFLNQLRDHNLVPENLYQKVIKMKSKERRRDGVYEILNWVEKKGGQCVKQFWSCVFQDHILQKYPVLRIHRNSLLDGSFKDYLKQPDEEEPDDTENKSESVQEEKKEGKRKRSVEEEEEEEPGPSTCSTPTRKKASRKPIFTSPLIKGENAKIWTGNLYKTTLPVTCGDQEGTLHRDKLARGIKCILHNGRWFTPNGFEAFAGKGRNKNWKFSIRCRQTPLLKLFQEGHLQCPRTKRRCVRKKILFPVGSSESSSPQSESGVMMEESNEDQEEEREEDEEQGEERHEGEKSIDEEEDEDEPVDLSEFEPAVLAVTCDSVTGELYKKRFTGGLRSKSIRTETRWFTPEAFVKPINGYWKRDILCHGKPLNYLLKKKVLYVHYLLCKCDWCRPVDPLAQNNDDVCFTCNDEGALVCCDKCPRAFHSYCHIPPKYSSTNGETWICTFCVWKSNEQLWVPMSLEEAVNSPVKQKIMQHCEYLLLWLYKEDVGRVFTYNPYTTVPGYSSVISNPMWLGRVKIKLQRNRYSTVGEFVDDIRLIFQNWKTFNRDKDAGMMGARLSEIFEQEFVIRFKIQ